MGVWLLATCGCSGEERALVFFSEMNGSGADGNPGGGGAGDPPGNEAGSGGGSLSTKDSGAQNDSCRMPGLADSDESMQLPSLDVTEAEFVLNRYAVLATDAEKGARNIELDNVANLDGEAAVFTNAQLSPGDLLLVYQAQGAEMLSAPGYIHGTLADLHAAGRYEFVSVASIDGNRVELEIGPEGLSYSYATSGHTQVVRVPRFESLTIQAGARVTAPPWDGQSGGIVSVWVNGELRIEGRIDADKLGFRGGRSEVCTDAEVSGSYAFRGYVSDDACNGGGAGEGVGGFNDAYATAGGDKGRAARLNGGGGGNAPNCAGGGGANASLRGNWTGCGATSSSAAWELDPGCAGGSITDGGGRGGYGWSAAEQDPLLVPPEDERWAGGRRAEAGGLGGRPLPIEPLARLFFGGGGGAGQNNDTDPSIGASGGGLVHIVAQAVTGNGRISANGDTAENASNEDIERDGQPGGGAGGSIVVLGHSIDVVLEAEGGSGADYEPLLIPVSPSDAFGGGGGGGGGVVVTSDIPSLLSVEGGRAGVSTHATHVSFPENGAAAGSPGLQLSVPLCADTPLCDRTGCPRG